MARPKILATIHTPDGWTVAIVFQRGLYLVGTLSSHGRFVRLETAQFATYDAASERLRTEAAAHRSLTND